VDFESEEEKTHQASADSHGSHDREEGHPDRYATDNEKAPAGNAYDLSRTAAPKSRAACVDDEANDDEMDIDERSVNSRLAMSDPTRTTAGTMNRRKMLDKYFREEVTAEEDRMWYGRHEY
jgi:hypothetical protein